MTASVSDQLGDSAVVLLGAPSMVREADDACIDMLTQAPPEHVSVLWISFRKPPGDCLSQWRERHNSDPSEFGVIVVGETMGTDNSSDISPQSIQTISNPSDLTGIGISVGEFISGRDEHIVVCFDSLTALLQYVDLETAYEFLHALTGQLYSAGAVAHFHIDPTAHDDQTVDTLLSLFDASVELGDGDPTVRTRYPSS